MMTGIACRNVVKAKSAGESAIQQHQSTSTCEVHHPLVLQLMQDVGGFVLQLKLWISGVDIIEGQLDFLRDWIAIFNVYRRNEISVESLHKLVSTEASHATNLSPVYVSDRLRSNEAFEGRICSMETLAQC